MQQRDDGLGEIFESQGRGGDAVAHVDERLEDELDIGMVAGELIGGIVVMAVANIGMWLLCRWMFRSGYRLKA